MIEVHSIFRQSLQKNATVVIPLCHDSWFIVLPFCATCSELLGGTRWRNWLRHYAIGRKVAGLSLNGVTGFFSLA